MKSLYRAYVYPNVQHNISNEANVTFCLYRKYNVLFTNISRILFLEFKKKKIVLSRTIENWNFKFISKKLNHNINVQKLINFIMLCCVLNIWSTRMFLVSAIPLTFLQHFIIFYSVVILLSIVTWYDYWW